VPWCCWYIIVYTPYFSRNLRVKRVENIGDGARSMFMHYLCSCTLTPSIGGRHDHAIASRDNLFKFQDSDGDSKFRIYWTKCWEKFEPTDTDRWCILATYLVGFASLDPAVWRCGCLLFSRQSCCQLGLVHAYANTGSSSLWQRLRILPFFVETSRCFQLEQTPLFTHRPHT